MFFGDVVGKSGRHAVAKILPQLREQHHPDLVIANVENLAHGKGITLHTMNALIETGVDFFTSGNHIFDKPEADLVFKEYGDKLIRPTNFVPEKSGEGYKIITVKGQPVLIANILGQVFMEKQIDEGTVASPFEKINEILAEAGDKVKIRVLDFHAEATSEKRAMGFWVDGRMSAVLGTHTHVATRDVQILPEGTGYLTDIGMTGAAHSIIGVDKDSALRRFMAQASGGKTALEVAESDKYEIAYAVLEIDEDTGKCQNINSFLIWI